jgi:hypothetical protein
MSPERFFEPRLNPHKQTEEEDDSDETMPENEEMPAVNHSAYSAEQAERALQSAQTENERAAILDGIVRSQNVHELAPERVTERIGEIQDELDDDELSPTAREELLQELRSLVEVEIARAQSEAEKRSEGSTAEESRTPGPQDEGYDESIFEGGITGAIFGIASAAIDAALEEKTDDGDLHARLGVAPGQRQEIRQPDDFYRLFFAFRAPQRFVLATNGEPNRLIDIEPNRDTVVLRETSLATGEGRSFEITMTGAVRMNKYGDGVEEPRVKEGKSALRELDDLFKELFDLLRLRVRPDEMREAA